MKISQGIVKKKKLIVMVWVLALFSIVQAVLNYSHFVSYSTSSGSTANTESSKAQAILASR